MTKKPAHIRKGHAAYTPQDLSALSESIDAMLVENGLGVGMLDLAMEDRGWISRASVSDTVGSLSRSQTLRLARDYAINDPITIQALRIHRVFVLGQGFSIESPDDKTQTAIDDLFANPRNKSTLAFEGLEETYERHLVDGSVALAILEGGDSAIVRRLDTLQITKIVTDPEDAGTVWGYERTWIDAQRKERKYYYPDIWAPDEAEPSPGFEEQDAKVRWAPYGRYGNSLVSPAMLWSKAHRQFMSARHAIQRALARFAWRHKMSGGESAVLSAVNFHRSGLAGGTGLEDNPAAAPGSTWVENSGSDLSPIKTDTGATAAQTDGDMLLQMATIPFGLMPHWFGSGTTAKFSTSDNMELPMLRMLEAGQKRQEELYRDVITHSLGLQNIAEPDFEITFPQIDKRKLSDFMEGVAKAVVAIPGIADLPAVKQIVLSALGVTNPAKELEGLEEEPDKKQGEPGLPTDAIVQAAKEVSKLAEALLARE